MKAPLVPQSPLVMASTVDPLIELAVSFCSYLDNSLGLTLNLTLDLTLSDLFTPGISKLGRNTLVSVCSIRVLGYAV